jgi:hypothetical protein
LRAGIYPHITRHMAHPNHELLSEIDAFCRTHEMSDAKFGRLALKDWKFVQQIRGEGRTKPRRVWPETESEVRKFIATYRPPERVKAERAAA